MEFSAKWMYAFAILGGAVAAWRIWQNLQKLRDGDRIDGRMRPEDEFEAIETGAADLDELLA